MVPVVHALLLHPAVELGSSFTVHPSTVIGLLAIGALYAWRAKRGPAPADLVAAFPGTRGARGDALSGTPAAADEGTGPTVAQRAMVVTALLLTFLTLNGPLHDLSDYYLFSGHMVQHLVLTLVVPPLLIAGTPGWMLRPLLRIRPVATAARFLTRTGVAFAVFNLVLATWHLPPLYNLALDVHEVHIAQHLMFIGGAVIMWWPLASRVAELPRPPYPVQMLYCFLMVIPMSIVSIYIVMADVLLYPAYAAAPRIWNIAPLADQQYGGLIMWIPGGVFFYLVMTVVFFKWVGRDEAVHPETLGAAAAPLAPVPHGGD
jgi:putative membrane protein